MHSFVKTGARSRAIILWRAGDLKLLCGAVANIFLSYVPFSLTIGEAMLIFAWTSNRFLQVSNWYSRIISKVLSESHCHWATERLEQCWLDLDHPLLEDKFELTQGRCCPLLGTLAESAIEALKSCLKSWLNSEDVGKWCVWQWSK